VTALELLGAPASPAADPSWWAELGEALLAKGDAAAVVTRLTPVAAALPDEAELQLALGAAQLATAAAEDAVPHLEAAARVHPTTRARQLLTKALATVAVTKLGAGDATAAEALLARADAAGGNPAVWRDLGLARLALGRPADAVAVLERAAAAEPSVIADLLVARAHAEAGDVAAARPRYERALAAAKDSDALEVALDWAASELAGGDPALAVAALERTTALAKDRSSLSARHRDALFIARHAAGLAALRGGNGARALDALRAGAGADVPLALRCDLGVAAIAAGEPAAAQRYLKSVVGQACPFPPPADTQAAPILIAFADGLAPRRAAVALERLAALAAKATGLPAALASNAQRVIALGAAAEASRAGDLAAARRFITQARAAAAQGGGDELALALAVLELVDGHLDAAIAALERIAPRQPEALIHLGIAYERHGDPARALDAWRRARKANVRFAPLGEWIDAKERIYGGAP
jgi:tetratricopeptide (TPR) repeat protein